MKKTLTLLLLLAGLTLDAQAEPLTWNGDENHMTWNTSSYYWWQGDAPALYTNGSDVVFGDIGSGEVVLDGTLKPGSVLVKADNDYIFSGKGKLSGSMQLTKNGGGTLTINTANDYSGGTIINSGTLVLDHDKALGTGVVTLGSETDSATLDLNKHSISNKITLEGSGSIGNGTVNGSISMEAFSSLSLNGTVNGSISMEAFSSLSLNGTVNGSISLGNNSELVLCGDLDGTGAIIMNHLSSLSCNGHILNKDVIVTTLREIDWFSIDAGTINGSILVAKNAEMDLHGDLHGTGTVTLEEGAALYCPRTSGSSSTLYKDVILTGSAYLFWASINGNVTVSEGKCLSLKKLDSSIAGTITLGEGASLNMEDLTLTLTDGSVVLSGANAQVGGGTLNGNVTVGEDKKLTLSGDLNGTGSITLEDNAMLDLNEKTLSHDVTLTGDAHIGTGTLNGSVSVAAGKCLYLAGKLDGEGSISLGDQSTLDLLYISILTKDVTLTGDATVRSGTINGNIIVGAENTLTLDGNLTGTVCIFLDDQSTLDLGNDRFSNNVIVGGSNATICNGTIGGNLILSEYATFTWADSSMQLAGAVIMGYQSTLDLDNHSISNDVIVDGSNATICNGTITGNVTVEAGKSLFLKNDVDIKEAITLGEGASLNMDGEEAVLSSKFTFAGQSATIDNATLMVESGETVTLNASLSGSATISLGNNATLDLGQHTLSNSVTLTGNASIGNGTLNTSLSVGDKKSLSLIGDLSGTGSITLGNQSTLNLCGHTLSNSVTLPGSASIGNGKLNTALSVDTGKKLTLIGDLSGTGSISLGDQSTLDLGSNTLSNSVTLLGSASIGNGKLNSALSVDSGKTLTLIGNLDGTGSISLGEQTTLALGGHTLFNSVTLSGSASIGNGVLDGSVSVNTGKTLTLIGNLDGEGSISLEDQSTLNLGGHTLSNSVTLPGSASIGNGKLNTALSVDTGKKLTLIGNLSGTGSISLGDQSTLDLGSNTLSNSVTLLGSASIGNGKLNTALSVDTGKTLTLIGDLSGTDSISLGDNATLDLDTYTLSKGVTLAGSSASIGNGRLDTALSVDSGKALTLIGNLSGTGSISLGNQSTLDLGGNTLSNSVTLIGSAAIGNGVLVGSVSVAWDKTLTLLGNLDGTGSISLGNQSTLDLGNYSFSNDVIVDGGNTTICNGTIGGNLILSEYATFTWADSSMQLAGAVIMGYQSTLDLDNHSLSNNVIVDGSNATICNGTITGNVTVEAGRGLFLKNDVDIKETITLGDAATLELGGNTLSNSVTLLGSATIGNGVLDCGIVVDTGKTLTFSGNLNCKGDISLGDNATLDLGKNTFSNAVTLQGSASIGNGTIVKDLSVGKEMTLSLIGSLSGEGSISLGDAAKLDLGGYSLNNNVAITADTASIGNGAINVDLTVGAGKTLYLLGDMGGSATVNLGDNATLDFGGKTLFNQINISASTAFIGNGTLHGDSAFNVNEKTLILCGDLKSYAPIMLWAGSTLNLNTHTLSATVILPGTPGAKATIGNGTLSGKVSVLGKEVKMHFSGETIIKNATIKAGATTVKSLDGAERSLLQEISVSDGLIAGIDRQSSLADGLYIESEADLLIESMTITANNEIHVGEHTITLNQVTIDLSKAEYKLVDSDYYFQLKDLINCTLQMDDVVFDASGLELPTGFDPGVNGIGMDFGDDVTINEQTARNLTLLMGGNWSQTMNLVDGKPVFTALVPTPEPATGTLSLLALAALAARRRRK